MDLFAARSVGSMEWMATVQWCPARWRRAFPRRRRPRRPRRYIPPAIGQRERPWRARSGGGRPDVVDLERCGHDRDLHRRAASKGQCIVGQVAEYTAVDKTVLLPDLV